MRVYKYEVPNPTTDDGLVTLSLPKGAKIISVGTQVVEPTHSVAVVGHYHDPDDRPDFGLQDPPDPDAHITVPDVQTQAQAPAPTEKIVLWAVVSDLTVEALRNNDPVFGKMQERVLMLAPTGRRVGRRGMRFENINFIGTVTKKSGAVWHVFEVTDEA